MEVHQDAELTEFLKFLTPECDQAHLELLEMFEFTDAVHAEQLLLKQPINQVELVEVTEVHQDAELTDFLKFLTPECDQAHQELLDMFEFADAERVHVQQPAVHVDIVTKPVKTRKPRVKDGAVVVQKVKQRHVSAQSIKFHSVHEEAHYRLYSTVTKKTALIDKLVRACYNTFGNTWVTWRQLKAMAASVGYKPSSQLFKSVWVLTHCLYGADNRNCTWVPALTFPYWNLDVSRYEEAVPLYGKMVAKDELYMLCLSEHFFTITMV